MFRSTFRTLLISLLLLFFLAGCSTGKNSPTGAVENYLNAIVSQNTTEITNNTCVDWEAQAQTEADSFAGVSAQIQNLSCTVSQQNGNSDLVACTGDILTSYNGEATKIDLSARTYKVIQDDGQWRMCGYQ